jgi:hypothetical protein
MGCAKSWLYTWKNRYQVTEPDWFQEYSRRPETTPTKTPDALEAQIVQLRPTLSPDGLGTVSAGVIRDHLRPHGAKSIPSRRTIYRILKRQAKEVNSPAVTSQVSGYLWHLRSGEISTTIDRVQTRTGGRSLEMRGLGATGSRQTKRGDGTQHPENAGKKNIGKRA